MRWRLDNPNAEQLIKDYERFGQDVPDSLVAPELHDIELSLWVAFWELSSDRQAGMTVGAIPWSSIRAYAQDFKALELRVFERIIRTMDNAYLSHESGSSKTFTREMLKG